ncbi:hypothetical protein V8E51_001780 [Hyaloscypha variabilis]
MTFFQNTDSPSSQAKCHVQLSTQDTLPEACCMVTLGPCSGALTRSLAGNLPGLQLKERIRAKNTLRTALPAHATVPFNCTSASMFDGWRIRYQRSPSHADCSGCCILSPTTLLTRSAVSVLGNSRLLFLSLATHVDIPPWNPSAPNTTPPIQPTSDAGAGAEADVVCQSCPTAAMIPTQKIQNYRSKDRGTEARRPKDERRQSHAAGALDPWAIAGPSVGGTQKSRFPGVRANLGEGDGPARSVPRPLLARFWVRTHSAHTHTTAPTAPSTTCTTARAAGLAPTTPTRHAPGPCRYGELQSVQWHFEARPDAIWPGEDASPPPRPYSCIAFAPIGEHTLPRDPEAMQPTRPTKRGRPMADTRRTRLPMLLWQKLNLAQAPAPAVGAAASLLPLPALDRPAQRLKPRKSLWAAVGSRMRRMPVHQTAGCLQHTRDAAGGQKRGRPPSPKNRPAARRASASDDGTGLLVLAAIASPRDGKVLDSAGLQQPATPQSQIQTSLFSYLSTRLIPPPPPPLPLSPEPDRNGAAACPSPTRAQTDPDMLGGA